LDRIKAFNEVDETKIKPPAAIDRYFCAMDIHIQDYSEQESRWQQHLLDPDLGNNDNGTFTNQLTNCDNKYAKTLSSWYFVSTHFQFQF